MAMNQTYGLVSCVTIEVDPELKYPKGTARVSLVHEETYVAALTRRFIYLPSPDGTKKVCLIILKHLPKNLIRDTRSFSC